MITPGDRLVFQPAHKDRMTLPVLKSECVQTGRVDFGDVVGSFRLWPGEHLTVLTVLDQGSVIVEFMKQYMLVLTADTTPETQATFA